LFYYVVRALAKLYLMITHGLSAEGSEKVPESGPVILVANHVHANDPLALAVACKRPLHFMAKAELFRNPLFGWFLRSLHAFPVVRGAVDRAAYRKSLEILAIGGVLAIFPEGTRNPSDGLLKPHPGAARFAQLTGAVVVPAFVEGTARVGQRIKVVFGDAIDPRAFMVDHKLTREATEAFSEAIMARVESLGKRLRSASQHT